MTDGAATPRDLHRTPCPVGDRLILCGDLHPDEATAIEQLDQWVSLGVRGIIDCREEWSDEELVARLAPGVAYIHVGTHDHGGSQPHSWFDRGVTGARAVLDADPEAKVLAHCHMGVNRGPSMALAILLDLGWDPIEALDAIRAARPIAAVAYATDAVHWHLRRRGARAAVIVAAVEAVNAWTLANEIDTAAVIGRIRDGVR